MSSNKSLTSPRWTPRSPWDWSWTPATALSTGWHRFRMNPLASSTGFMSTTRCWSSLSTMKCIWRVSLPATSKPLNAPSNKPVRGAPPSSMKPSTSPCSRRSVTDGNERPWCSSPMASIPPARLPRRMKPSSWPERWTRSSTPSSSTPDTIRIPCPETRDRHWGGAGAP